MMSPSDEKISRRNWERFLRQSSEIEPHEVIVCRADVNLALHNAVRGAQQVLAYEVRIQDELPKVDLSDFHSIDALAKSVEYAARQVDRHAPSKELRELIGRGRELRLILLTAAESLAAVGILEKHVVAKIRSGHGDIDAAGDCVELAALFSNHATAVRGKTPVNAALVKEAAEVGSTLLTLLRPKKSRTPTEVKAEVREARELRDRLWTLLVRRHDRLRRVGAYLFGLNELDRYVPPLQSAKRAPAAKSAKTDLSKGEVSEAVEKT